MVPEIENILREFEKRSDAEWERMELLQSQPAELAKQVDEFLLAVGPATGQLLNLLVKELEAQTILEVGSSYGYSTVWLAEAAQAIGGKVISLEIHPGKQQHARETIAKAGLADYVDFRLGNATELIAKIDVAIDFVLLDLWKNLYVQCFDLFYPKLSPGALIAADNMILPENSRKQAAAYQDRVRSTPDIQSILLPVGSGIELSRFTGGVSIV